MAKVPKQAKHDKSELTAGLVASAAGTYAAAAAMGNMLQNKEGAELCGAATELVHLAEHGGEKTAKDACKTAEEAVQKTARMWKDPKVSAWMKPLHAFNNVRSITIGATMAGAAAGLGISYLMKKSHEKADISNER